MAVQTQILHRRGTAATWTSTNPTLGAGEVGFETDTGKFKLGDGTTAWASLPYAAIDAALLNAKGDLVTATANDTPARLAVGANETRLVADSAQATGLKYVADTTNYAVNAKGDLLAGTAADTVSPLTVGANETRLVADSTQATGLKYVADTTNYAIAAKGDLLAGTAADTVSALTVGSNGQDLVADSSTATGLRWRDNFAAGKNAVLNADFRLWTRGTSFTPAASSETSTADKFAISWNGTGTSTFSQQAFTAGTAPVAGYEGTYFHRCAMSSGATYVYVAQKIEDVRTFAGQTVTLSFWAKASGSAFTTRPILRQNFGTGGSANVDVTGADTTFTTSWARYSFTVTLGSISGKTIGTNSSLTIFPINFQSGTIASYSIDIWGVQLEPGSVATAFETATGNPNSEVVASGAISDGVLVSLNASTNPSGSGSNAWAGYQVAGKNKIINGDFSIWQRGTSIAGTASTTNYVSDRWVGYRVGATFSRQATSDTTNLPNIQYSARAQRDSGNTAVGKIFLTSSIESVNSIPFAGKTVTFSFYARRGANYSSASNLLTSYFVSGTGTDQNILAGFTGSTSFVSDVTLTTTWQRFTITGNVPTTATQLGVGFEYTPSGTAGANDWFEVTGVQLEAGSVATPFTTATGTIQGELAACQRYYEKSYNQDVAPGTVSTPGLLYKGYGASAATSGTTGYLLTDVRWKVEKRGTPTLTIYDGAGTSGVVTAENPGTGQTNGNTLYTSNIGTSGAQIGRDGSSGTRTSTNTIAFHYVASSEL